MLTGEKILQEIKAGRITIDPFDESRINPNSYNLRIDIDDVNILKPNDDNYGFLYMDITKKQAIAGVCPFLKEKQKKFITITPGRVYLASTIERTASDYYIPHIDGRSSIARCGLSIHITAGFGDIGYNGKWTLEIVNHNSFQVIIPEGTEIAQISFYRPDLSIDEFVNANTVSAVEGGFPIPQPKRLYRGRYQNANKAEPAKLNEEETK